MLSYTQISLFESCPRKWYLNYVMAHKEPDSPVLQFGSSVHKVLESYIWSGNFEKSLSRELGNLDPEFHTSLRTLTQEAILTTQEHFKIKLVNQSMPEFKTNGIEETLIYNDFKGVIDLILRVNGKLFILDWKTSAFDYTEHQIRTSDQLVCYSWLLNRVYDVLPEKVYYVVLNKRNESCKLYSTTVSPAEIDEWEEKVEQIRQVMHSQIYYKNAKSCDPGWGLCPFYEMCWPQKAVTLPNSLSVPQLRRK